MIALASPPPVATPTDDPFARQPGDDASIYETPDRAAARRLAAGPIPAHVVPESVRRADAEARALRPLLEPLPWEEGATDDAPAAPRFIVRTQVLSSGVRVTRFIEAYSDGSLAVVHSTRDGTTLHHYAAADVDALRTLLNDLWEGAAR